MAGVVFIPSQSHQRRAPPQEIVPILITVSVNGRIVKLKCCLDSHRQPTRMPRCFLVFTGVDFGRLLSGTPSVQRTAAFGLIIP